MDNRPIGVFDSGLGGLTVVNAINRLLPHEDIVYFGDTGRVPYGTRSREAIREYAKQDEAFLLSKDVKMIIAACGTVSSVAYDTGDDLPVPFLGVVSPAATLAAEVTKTGRIGVIGTTATIESGAYQKVILSIDSSLEIIAEDCPLFVPMVEAGWIDKNDEITKLTVKRYLENIKAADVDTLILGCTHFPLISEIIDNELGGKATLISAGEAAAAKAVDLIKETKLCCDKTRDGVCEFYVTDRPEGFKKTAGRFLQRTLDEHVFRVSPDQLV